MALDPKYVIAPSLQMYFVDKDSGLPLVNGQVYFFRDNERTIPKDVFELSGLEPNYTYTVLPNPSLLSSVGTFQDGSGNDILPYYYPFTDDGTELELYYIEVYDSMGVLQFTREGWPNLTAETAVSGQDITNFVANGQFLLHDSIPASQDNTYIAGKVSQTSTIIAQGGWSFDRSPASTATDFVTFPQYTAYTGIPSGNPRYAVQIQTTVSGSDTVKDLRLKFPGVTTFASTTQAYNLYFEGEALNGSDINNVEIFVIKNYGTGGTPSAETSESFGSITLINGTVRKYNIPIVFGTTAGKIIGTNNDDYIQIVLRLPPTSTQTALFTDFALTLGDAILTEFPIQTEAQQLAPSTAGWFPVPNPLGFDLYCPAVLGPSGLLWDHSSIGEVLPMFVEAASITGNLLLCDGTQYRTANYSTLGIPYQRLQTVLFNTTYNAPLFGTGVNFMNVYTVAGGGATFMLSLNKAGSVQTNPADGTTATGFTFNVNVNKSGTNPGYVSRSNSLGVVVSTSTFTDLPAAGVSAGTSGMSVYDYTEPSTAGGTSGETAIKYSFVLTALSANTLSTGIGVAGKYFEFSNHTVTYRVWFKVNGEIAPAAGGHTLYEVDLSPGMTVQDVGIIISNAIAGLQNNTITAVGAASITGGAGSFFTANANSIVYTFWYKINGVGAAPGSAANPIQITLVGNETATQVATKTQIAINSVFFAVPDLRGVFLRGNDPTSVWDTALALRTGYIGSILDTDIGTYELSQLIVHKHPGSNVGFNVSTQALVPGAASVSNNAPSLVNIGPEGGSENRPVNVSVNYYIRY